MLGRTLVRTFVQTLDRMPDRTLVSFPRRVGIPLGAIPRAGIPLDATLRVVIPPVGLLRDEILLNLEDMDGPIQDHGSR